MKKLQWTSHLFGIAIVAYVDPSDVEAVFDEPSLAVMPEVWCCRCCIRFRNGKEIWADLSAETVFQILRPTE